jgi:hypothetical protein
MNIGNSDKEPTAYDVDKVIEELTMNSQIAEVPNGMAHHHPKPMVSLDKAIEIVKRGGKQKIAE